MMSIPFRLRSALSDLRKKLTEGNQFSVCLTLEVIDFVMKNCSIEVRDEILGREFLSTMKNIVIVSGPHYLVLFCMYYGWRC